MNVKGGYGIHYPTIQGSPAFLSQHLSRAKVLNKVKYSHF